MADLILEIVEGPEAGRQVPLDGAVEIGREEGLAISVQDEQASRRHARISLQNGQAVVEDLGSTNGTYVNDQATNVPRALQPGDRIRCGLTVVELRSSQQVAAQPSAVRPVPQITAVGQGVLQPVAPQEFVPQPPPAPPSPAAVPAQAAPQPGGPGFLSEESEPAFVPREVVGDVDAESDYAAVARLVDTRVRAQTNVAVFALIGAAVLAVALVFGLK